MSDFGQHDFMSLYYSKCIVINAGVSLIFQYWKRFGLCCQRAQGIFSVQSKDAYKFLEINPSSLSQDERNKQYKTIMEKLKKINPQGSAKAAIAQ